MAMNYDLRRAMSHTKQGIHNFYSYLDVPMLEGFCLLTGTGDGKYGLSSGMVGFHPPKSLTTAAREVYAQGLHQRPFDLGMLKDGHWGGHFGWMGPLVLARHIAPLLDTPPTDKVPTDVAGSPELQSSYTKQALTTTTAIRYATPPLSAFAN